MPENHDQPQRPPAPPWWLQDGEEMCPHCGQAFHLEQERRCAACDAPSCPHCLDAQSLCSDCAQEPAP